MLKIKKIGIGAIIISFILNPLTFNISEASLSYGQQKAINQMNETLNDLEDYGKEVKRDYQRQQADFDMAMAKSKADAIQNKKELDERFNKMREEFDKKSPKLESQEENKIKVDPRIFDNKLSSDFSFDMGQDNDGSLSNVRVNDDINQDSELSINKSQPSQNKKRASLVDDDIDDKDYNRALNKVAGESKIENDDTKNTTNLFNQNTPVKNTFTKDNFMKFTIAVIFVFIFMAILFFLGKRKN